MHKMILGVSRETDVLVLRLGNSIHSLHSRYTALLFLCSYFSKLGFLEREICSNCFSGSGQGKDSSFPKGFLWDSGKVNDFFKTSIEERFSGEASAIIDGFDWEKVEGFYQFLKDKNEIGGFFSKSDSEQIWERHILESLYHIFRIQKEIPVSRETRVLDVGTGPGLPGYLFYCLKQAPVVFLSDSQARRLKHLQQFSLDSNQKPAPKFLYQRMEEIREKFDLVVMRSTIPFPWSIEMVSHLVLGDGYFLPFLGKENPHIQKEELFCQKFGFRLEKEILLSELEFLGRRHIKFLKKNPNSKDSSRRDWSAIQKEIRKENG